MGRKLSFDLDNFKDTIGINKMMSIIIFLLHINPEKIFNQTDGNRGRKGRGPHDGIVSRVSAGAFHDDW